MNKFTDAQKMQEQHPDTFEAPTLSELDEIVVGDNVKVCHNDERFWVEVKEINGNNIKGVVNNDLICNQPFNYGDEIAFCKKHIYCIY